MGMTQITFAAEVSDKANLGTVIGGGCVTIDWVNTVAVDLAMSLSNGRVHWDGVIQGASGTSSIIATYTLERWNGSGWSFQNAWSSSTNSSFLISSGSHSGSSGLYRLTVNAVVTRNGFAEQVNLAIERWL